MNELINQVFLERLPTVKNLSYLLDCRLSVYMTTHQINQHLQTIFNIKASCKKQIQPTSHNS